MSQNVASRGPGSGSDAESLDSGVAGRRGPGGLSRVVVDPQPRRRRRQPPLEWVAPLVLLLVLGGVTLFFWRLEVNEQNQQLDAKTAWVRTQLVNRMETALHDHLERLQATALRWMEEGQASPEKFYNYAHELLVSDPVFETVGWVNREGVLQRYVPMTGLEAEMERDLALNASWAAPIAMAMQTHGPAGSPIREDRLGGEYWACATPIAERGADGKYAYAGAVVGILHTQVVIERAVLDETQGRFDVRIWAMDSGRPLYPRKSPAVLRTIESDEADVANIHGQRWGVRLTPLSGYADDNTSESADLKLWGGTLTSLLVSGALYQLLHHRRREEQKTRDQVAALESLSEVSAAISAKLGSGPQVMDLLADSVRKLTKMKAATVCVTDRQFTTLTFIATSGLEIPLRGVAKPLHEMQGARQCMLEGKPILVADRLTTTLSVNQMFMNQLGLRSLMQLPLVVEGRPAGVLTIADTHPREFGEEDVRLATLLASQASVILSNHRLYSQIEAALAKERWVLMQRERLSAVNAAIFQAATLELTLERIVELAPSTLGVDVAVVCLRGETRDTLKVAAVTRGFAKGAKLLGERFNINGSIHEMVFQAGAMREVVDARQEPLCNARLVEALDAASVLYLALARDGAVEPLGQLMLIRHKPGMFGSEQLEMAQVFATRASAAVENARLYEQTRRDAETKAMLLRELNHRVKNSLAGIIGLLSMHEPDMPEGTRRWLDRAIERIQNMARTYDLFSGGLTTVHLDELINRMLPSLAVIKPSGVTVRTAIADADLCLRTDRAVSLAMVLHELCYNAIVHGLDEVGTVTISAFRSNEQTVAIEVIDDGTRNMSQDSATDAGVALMSPPSAQTHARSTGMGLYLVKGLVARELHGKFTFEPRPEGGMVARVEFPLESDDAVDIGASV